MSRKKET
jgi:hypothetical protein